MIHVGYKAILKLNKIKKKFSFLEKGNLISIKSVPCSTWQN